MHRFPIPRILPLMRCFACGLWAVIAGVLFAEVSIAEVRLESGPVDRCGSVVRIDLGLERGAEAGPLAFEDASSGQHLPLQAAPDAAGAYLTRLDLPMPAGTARTFHVVPVSETANASHRLIDAEGHLLLQHQGQPILRYNEAPHDGKPWTGPGQAPAARHRSGNLHPIWSPAGERLTEIFPDALPHHLGVWVGWVKSEHAGQALDFWNLKRADEIEQIRFDRWLWQVSEGPVMAGFKAAHEYTVARKAVLDETLAIQAFAENAGILLDYTVEQTWLANKPLRLKQHTYGGMLGWRYPSAWSDDSVVEASGGVRQTLGQGSGPVDASRARWVKIEGRAGEATPGFLIMSHPDNFRHPESLRIRHDGPGEGGYIHFTPIREAGWQLESGHKTSYRYRIFLFDGELSAQTAELKWQQFVEPPLTHLRAP